MGIILSVSILDLELYFTIQSLNFDQVNLPLTYCVSVHLSQSIIYVDILLILGTCLYQRIVNRNLASI